MTETVRPLHILLKGLVLFVLINVSYALLQPPIAKLSIHNLLVPGRERLPFGESLLNTFVVSIDNIDAMFATHAISAPKRTDEIRIAVIGDSSVWGENLRLDETLTSQWNVLDGRCGEKSLEIYNLGYPHPSAVKDLMFIEKITEHDPDVIVWMITLNTLSSRRVNPILLENRDAALRLLEAYDLPFYGVEELALEQETFIKNTIIGRRSFLARWFKLQALGFLWFATDKDTILFTQPEVVSEDVSDDLTYRDLLPGDDLGSIMLIDALAAGYDIVGGIPVLLVNEPIHVATGLNSDLRYNEFYPRWAYDQYRETIASRAAGSGWHYLDLWNFIPQQYFTDTALHLNAAGEKLLAERLDLAVRSIACK